MSTGLPVIDEGGDEVNAGFVGHHKALLQTTATTQIAGAKLVQIGAHLIIEAHVDLTEALHIVHIHTHHVTKTVNEEHGMSAVSQGIIRVALHEADVLQALGDDASGSEVAVPPFHAGSRHLMHAIMSRNNCIVNITLLLGEAAADGRNARVVGTVALIGLGTTVTEHQASGLQGTG